MKHTLKVRTRRWDKETRKIEWYDGVRMMQQREQTAAEVSSTENSTSARYIRSVHVLTLHRLLGCRQGPDPT